MERSSTLLKEIKKALAPVNKIIPISSVDGPGARSAVFLQRCHITCLYCHNPETQRLCINCGDCVPTCPTGALTMANQKVSWDEELCIQCDTCLASCSHFSTPKITMMTAGEVFEKISKNRSFIRGITVSGGECSLYPAFLTELFTLAKAQKLTCLMDSSGMTDLSHFPDLIAKLDGVMLDVKAWEQGTYQVLTKAASNNVVKKNLAFLATHQLLTEIRIVNVPDYVDAWQTIEGIAEVIGDQVKVVPLKLIAFRNDGVKGILANHRSPTHHDMMNLKEKAKSVGYKRISII